MEPNAFRPKVARKHLDKETEAIGMHKVSGFQDAQWFSPRADGASMPYSDIELIRQAAAANRMHMMDRRWLCKLARGGTMIKKDGTDEWFLGVGTIDDSLAVLWPLERNTEQLYTVDTSRFRVLQSLLEPSEWLSADAKWASPMQQAARVEVAKLEGPCRDDRVFDLKAARGGEDDEEGDEGLGACVDEEGADARRRG